jgi:glycosyltransferase involved in cell wall biosynthesis
MRSGIIVLAPPWPRSGGGNLFSAQVAAHARRGARVFLLLTPLGRGFSRGKISFWQDATSAMRFPGVEAVSYPRMGRGRVRSYLQWLLAGRDDAIAVSARYGESGSMPGEFTAFVASTRVDLIHANHVFSIPLAERVARIVQASQGRRPPILLDTHDVQSDVFATGRRKNPLSHRPDPHDALLRTELALCARVDALIHVTQADCDFFATHLPAKDHRVILPTLAPCSEAELARRRGARPTAGSSLIYVGNRHEANLATVRWLLDEVLPLAGPDVPGRLCIVGAIGALLRRRDPELFRRHAAVFMGEVASVFDSYTEARAVLAPAKAGTGTSIKLIEALCAGKPVLTTSHALRGLPAAEMTGADIEVQDTAGSFAAALTRLCDGSASAPATSSANATLYDRLFSNERYFAALDDVVEGRSRRPSALLAAE